MWRRSRRRQSRPPTMASYCTWFRNTEDSDCSQKAWRSCAILTEPHVSPVTHSGRDDAALATSAEVILHSKTFVLAIPFQDRRQPGHQDAAPDGMPVGQQPPQRLQPVLPGDPLDDSPLPNCLTRNIVFTDRDKQLLVELRRASADGTPALRCLSSRHCLGRKPRRSHERSPVLGLALPLPLSPALGRGPQRH